jgi:PLD-like domain
MLGLIRGCGMAVEQPDLNAIIDERLADFDKPGVLSVRPGFKVRNDWLTGARSIVVTVRKKVAHRRALRLHLSPYRDGRTRGPGRKATETGARSSPAEPDRGPERSGHGRGALRQALGGEFSQAWALTRLDKEATAWIFPTAYHIKVAVRDRSALWLSSGNWNNSNQPAIDPFTTAADAQEARHRDRDWHVVIQQPQLAGVFEDYILHDLAVAAEHNNPPEQPGPPLTPPPLGSIETPEFDQFFPAASVTGTIKIAPLLTPDPGVYADAVRAFIGGATRTLYMQFQYIEPPRAGSTDAQGFIDLINVRDRQGNGVELKIIMSEFEKAGYLEQLQGMGLDTVNNVKIQNNVHNKGIIVDGSAVLVSSQNWSSDGTFYNRDAGVIIYNETAAQYFQQIFPHDWNHLAIQKAQPD